MGAQSTPGQLRHTWAEIDVASFEPPFIGVGDEEAPLIGLEKQGVRLASHLGTVVSALSFACAWGTVAFELASGIHETSCRFGLCAMPFVKMTFGPLLFFLP